MAFSAWTKKDRDKFTASVRGGRKSRKGSLEVESNQSRYKRSKKIQKQVEKVKFNQNDLSRVRGTRNAMPKEEDRVFALKQSVVIPPFVETARELTVYTQIPKSIEMPTAGFTNVAFEQQQTGWEISPMAFPAIGSVVGAIMVMSAKNVLASIVVSEVENWRGRQSYNVMGRDISVRVHTGRGAGRGRYMRIRGEGGELADDDADPYDQPSEWWEFWKWF